MSKNEKTVRGAECPVCGKPERWVRAGIHWSETHCCHVPPEESEEADR